MLLVRRYTPKLIIHSKNIYFRFVFKFLTFCSKYPRDIRNHFLSLSAPRAPVARVSAPPIELPCQKELRLARVNGWKFTAMQICNYILQLSGLFLPTPGAERVID